MQTRAIVTHYGGSDALRIVEAKVPFTRPDVQSLRGCQ